MRRILGISFGILALAATTLADDWPQFRGPHRDGVSRETGLYRTWPADGPKVLWTTEVCQGYAAAAIHDGKVYFNDYGEQAAEWYVRCLSLADGKELWRFSEKKRIRPNHAITRTVPAVDGQYVFSFDPKSVFHCLDAKTGTQLWRKAFVQEYQTRNPPWYNGQCPLIEPDRVVVAPGGEALMVAFDKATGEELWRTPNPDQWPMSHCSVMPAELGGVRQYVWCTLKGLVGVAADDGRILWTFPRKFNIAVAPSPVVIDAERVFMTSCYEAGSVMIRVGRAGETFAAEEVFALGGDEWNSECHTPILHDNHLFAVGKKKRGLFTCLDLDGREIWDSREQASFGLGSFILADNMFYILEGKTGMLRLLEANTDGYRQLGNAQVLHGHDVWSPLALSDGKLVIRDMTKMVCLEVGPSTSQATNNQSTAHGPADPMLSFAPAALRAENQRVQAQPPAECNMTGDEAEARYHRQRVIGGRGTGRGQFAEALRALAVDARDRLYAAGDSKLVIFSPEGELLATWLTERPAYSVAVNAAGRVYVGQPGQVQIFDGDGKLLDTWRDAERMGLVTAIGFAHDGVILADTRDRCLRRYDASGNFAGNIGKDNRTKGFLVPNGYLDFALDANDIIHVCNPGKHRVERYTLDDKLLGHIGRFGGKDPAGFSGCCNPTNVTLTSGGRVVVTTKVEPLVKIYTAAGKLVALVGRGDFDPNCKNMDVAVDSRGRICVIDTVRLHICIFAPGESGSTSRPAESTGHETVTP